MTSSPGFSEYSIFHQDFRMVPSLCRQPGQFHSSIFVSKGHTAKNWRSLGTWTLCQAVSHRPRETPHTFISCCSQHVICDQKLRHSTGNMRMTGHWCSDYQQWHQQKLYDRDRRQFLPRINFMDERMKAQEGTWTRSPTIGKGPSQDSPWNLHFQSPFSALTLEFVRFTLWIGNTIFVSMCNIVLIQWGFPGGSVVTNLSVREGDAGSIPESWRSPEGRHRTPGFLPGELHGHRSLAG